MSASASSSSPGLPTPTARDWKGEGFKGQSPNTLRLLPTPTGADGVRGADYNRANRSASGTDDLVTRLARLLPTPTSADARHSANFRPDGTPYGAGYGQTLTDAARRLLPTPTAASYGSNQSASPGAAVRPSLDAVARKLLPTPRASDGAKGGPNQRGSAGDLTLPSAAARLLPTPRASDTGTPGRRASEGWRPPLSQVVLPLASDSETTDGSTGKSTAPRSRNGKRSSAAPIPGQLTIEVNSPPSSTNG